MSQESLHYVEPYMHAIDHNLHAQVSPTFAEQSQSWYDQEDTKDKWASPNRLLHNAAVEYEDDDYYDVQSDEEVDMDTHSALVVVNKDQRLLHKLLVADLSDEFRIRRYDTFIYDGILDTYRAERVANPLKNPATARVFAHFISATGPSLSTFDRHPRNASIIFSEGPVPFSQQGMWTYTMPMAALHHQALLHAMLAMGSLHIAKLQGASETPSLKHYAYALKRVHHCVGHPKKRRLVTTLAASLLLGFYEVITADHVKWNSHLAGAKQLVVETDFAGMTEEFKRMKAEKAARDQHRKYYDPDSLETFQTSSPRDVLLDEIPGIDEGVVSTLIGRKLRYDDFDRIIDESQRDRASRSIPEPLDIEKYETLKDLYWWYCKQDVYQSLISGNPLL
ncbi:hypothetical protein LTR66_008349 [Elasticomyces elasticus]|nr:hypothetical protein LTR66_008349 [Elasticomyces elasticus]